MKKVTVFILTFILFIPIVNGKNINDLYGELNALESQKNLYSYLNSEDIKSLSNNGLDIQIIIDSLNDEINELDKEITSKEEFINSLKEEIDNVMVYNQVSQGENIYLEYIFAAETYSDMVYRYMIAEQINNYNNTMIEEMNKEIEELNKKKEELNEKINKLDKENLHIDLIEGGEYTSVTEDGEIAGALAIKAAHDNIGKVVINYLDSDSNKLTEEVTTTGEVGTEYTTIKKEFDDYTFIMVEGPTSGEYDFDTIYVTYYYDKNTGTGDIMPPQTGFEPSTINNNRVEVITLYKKED